MMEVYMSVPGCARRRVFFCPAAAISRSDSMNTQGNFKPALALDAPAIARSVKRIAHEIVERNDGAADIVLVGIVRRGARLAERLAEAMAEGGKRAVPVGTLDISSYRDDGRGAPGDPRLLGRDIPFALDRHPRGAG